MGFSLLLLIGLDQAPNTSRLRLIYLTEEEENEIVQLEIDQVLASHYGLVAPKDNEYVQWLQTIADNLAVVAVDDIRDPVRQYTADEPKKEFDVNIICDSSTLNAMCAGSRLLVYDLMIQYMDYDSTKIAVILSHEIAHAIQRHFVETHGFASLMFMLGDISRGVFWIVTESLGPYINQKINDAIATFITMETQTTYNRRLEKEADLVGLKLLAKAGYDPTTAIEVWTKMAELDRQLEKNADRTEQMVSAANEEAGDQRKVIEPRPQATQYEDLELGVREFIDSLLRTWFGSSHPPSQERLEYMRDHMDEAIALYQDAIRINGQPKEYIFTDGHNAPQFQPEEWEKHNRGVKAWFQAMFSWIWPNAN
ncbi:hypothetical protein DFQ28_010845 [Apophysomyces sp. BC1034]|nr:hypothetical protein DFQ30_008679 [Apophysomyces sp. BC1015]KAG0176678.1 hypothetical protein DFQ29_005829 [Apophysomyces sp. BC1021]KAG0191816.1 hypothetical protein DFQ28_010845 [Apophysomyces sp. BC1034]